MNLDKQEELFCNRLKELANNCYFKGIPICTDFLNLNEIQLFYSIKGELPNIQFASWGGYSDAERRVICFYTDDSFHNEDFPISLIKISPSNIKFSSELNHRDFLGSILNLGIERSTIGDIVVDDKTGYVYTNNKIAPFIMDNLEKVKHTKVKCQIMNPKDMSISPKYKEVKGTVSSKRLDAILSLGFQLSRSNMIEYIRGGKVFVNGRIVESNSYVLKDNDLVSVRGMGKFKFQDSLTMTKKGRYSITILKYI